MDDVQTLQPGLVLQVTLRGGLHGFYKSSREPGLFLIGSQFVRLRQVIIQYMEKRVVSGTFGRRVRGEILQLEKQGGMFRREDWRTWLWARFLASSNLFFPLFH
jgi:hypothetical protein